MNNRIESLKTELDTIKIKFDDELQNIKESIEKYRYSMTKCSIISFKHIQMSHYVSVL